MDQVLSNRLCKTDQMEEIVSSLGGGIVLVDAGGKVAWVDAQTRRRLNGGLRHLALPVRRSGRPAIDCFISTVEVMIDGAPSSVCVIQEIDHQEEQRPDLAAAVDSVIADTSWLTKAIIEKLEALRQAVPPLERSSDVDFLTDRERDVLGLICEGRNDGEMSAILNLSQNTVRNHVASLYRKIGVNRRSAAVIWARERAAHAALPLREKAAARRSAR